MDAVVNLAEGPLGTVQLAEKVFRSDCHKA
jgi:hypothetical protein